MNQYLYKAKDENFYVCYKCSNLGCIPVIIFKKKQTEFLPVEQIFGCDCALKKPFIPYTEAFKGDFQFPYSREIMFARDEKYGLVTYHEIYQMYSHEFWSRYRKDKKALINTDVGLFLKTVNLKKEFTEKHKTKGEYYTPAPAGLLVQSVRGTGGDVK